MSRRPQQPALGRVDTARARMAPGGRMWSESPIRHPRRRTATGGVPEPATPPTSAEHLPVSSGTIISSLSIAAPAAVIPTTAVAVVGIGIEWTAPSGWTVLAEGTQVAFHWKVLAVNEWAGTESFAITLSEDTVAHGSVTYFAGSSGGAWYLVEGPTYEGSLGVPGWGGFALPPSGAQAFTQTIIANGVYGQPSDPGGCSVDAGFMGAVSYPEWNTLGNPSYTGTEFTDAMVIGPPKGALDTSTWTTKGAYGVTNSASFSLGWKG